MRKNVRGGQQPRPRHGQTGEELCPEPFGEQCCLVDVGQAGSQAAQAALGAGVGRADQVHGPAEDDGRGGAAGVPYLPGDGPEQRLVLQRFETVPLDGLE
ncbi:hypothetical protein [Streptomyces sp. 769]|uniref:hypothetical protein n=1 Tax=Streptomyces sp. 769 TaxID=1262452 RepID=UPI00193A0F72|nr:hypothetical protein [Streptomyces sp. 769]